VDAASLRQSDPSPSSGYLSNYVSELTGCGNIDSPWRVRALPGQRVNLTLVDFGVASLSDAVTPPPPAAAADTAAAVPSVCQVPPTDCIGCCDCLSFDRNVFWPHRVIYHIQCTAVCQKSCNKMAANTMQSRYVHAIKQLNYECT